MAQVFDWPARWWRMASFSMRVVPNTRAFTNPYSAQSDVVDLLGEYWQIEMQLPPIADEGQGAELEAFFDGLRGPVNLVRLWHLRRPTPRGTLRGTPTLRADVAQLANVLPLQARPGETVLPGDHVGAGEQLFRTITGGQADSAGHLDVTVEPRTRTALPSTTAVVWDSPSATFRQPDAGGVPIVWRPGQADGPAVRWIEDF